MVRRIARSGSATRLSTRRIAVVATLDEHGTSLPPPAPQNRPRSTHCHRHHRDYQRYATTVDLNLNASNNDAATQAQRYFDLGHYLLISSSRPGTQAATLQGIWNTDVRPG